MALLAQKSPPENLMEERLARIESDVKHIQSDVTEIKTDVKRLDAKIDDVDKRLSAKIDDVDKRLSAKIDVVKDGLASLAISTERAIFEMRTEITSNLSSMKVWAVTLYVALASGLLLIMARGFQWI
jgi:peptidoglycan hydrolase CwlO-like protein